MTVNIIHQIDDVITQYREARKISEYDDCSDLPYEKQTLLLNLLSSTVQQLSPPGSQYEKNLNEMGEKSFATNPYYVPHLVGMLLALKQAYQKGYLRTVEELIHADLFSDFLKMSEYLLREGYKDPAAVIAGSVLEQHLRKLCIRNGIAVETNRKPKKADTLNSELAAKTVYSKLDQKSVTAWLDLRNKAAHGKYSEYNKDQVDLMIKSVQDFLLRNPA